MDYFRSIFTNVAGEINQLNQSTPAALDEASSLAETIARHKKSLANSAGDLSREQGDLDQMLTARRDSLESLVNSIKARREDLEGLTHSFAERIENSFEKAATRARDIGAFLPKSSQSTGGMIDRQFAGIRANIERSARARRRRCALPASRPMRSSRAFSGKPRSVSNPRRRSCAICRARSSANSKRPAKPCAVAPPICRRRRRSRRLPCGVPSPIRSRRSRS